MLVLIIRVISSLLLMAVFVACERVSPQETLQQSDFMIEARLAEKLDQGLTPNSYHNGKPLLNVASSMRSCEAAVKLLIRRGADLHLRSRVSGKTALFEAAAIGSVELATILLDAGADPKVQDYDGETPLREAALGKKMRMVQFLISRGADPKTRNKKGKTVADQVRESTTPEILALLEAER